jgi:hypothetical protein
MKTKSKKFKLASMLLALTAMTGAAEAATIAYFPFLFTGADAGGTLIEDGSYAVVIDMDGDGADGNPYTSAAPGAFDNYSNWLWDADDILLDRGPVGIVNGEAGWAFPIGNTNTSATDNKNWYILWFDVAFDGGAAGPGQGVDYGAEDLGTIPSTDATLTPFAIGGNANLTTNTTGPVIVDIPNYFKLSNDAPTMPTFGPDIQFDPNLLQIVDLGTPQTGGAVVIDGLVGDVAPLKIFFDLGNFGGDIDALLATLNNQAERGDDANGNFYSFQKFEAWELFAQQGWDFAANVLPGKNPTGDNFAFEFNFDFAELQGVTVTRLAVVPTPAALPAGLALLGTLAMARRRGR